MIGGRTHLYYVSLILCLHAVLLAGIFYLATNRFSRQYQLTDLLPPQTAVIFSTADLTGNLQQLANLEWWEDFSMTPEGIQLMQVFTEAGFTPDSTYTAAHANRQTFLFFLTPNRPIGWAIITEGVSIQKDKWKSHRLFNEVVIYESGQKANRKAAFQLGSYSVFTTDAFLAELIITQATASFFDLEKRTSLLAHAFNTTEQSWVAINTNALLGKSNYFANQVWVLSFPKRHLAGIEFETKLFFHDFNTEKVHAFLDETLDSFFAKTSSSILPRCFQVTNSAPP